MTNKTRLFLSAALVAAALGCASDDASYRPAPQILPANILKIALRPVVNKTQQFGLEDKLTLRVRDEFLRDGRYPLVPEAEADGIVLVTVARYILVPTQYDSVLTPTAYRGLGRSNRPGLGLDVNVAYFIGRLYGKNSLPYTTNKTNYIDRLGVLFLGFDGKMQIQSEGSIRPAVAAGAQANFFYRDAPQPALKTVDVTVNPASNNTRLLSGAYVVASKNIAGVRSSLGFMQGDAGNMVGMLSEFLTDQALLFDNHPGQTAASKSVLFASLLTLPTPSYPLAVELMKPNGMPLNPWLLNFKLGHFLKLNFDLAYLKFNGGWDLLGTFAFRYTEFPKKY